MPTTSGVGQTMQPIAVSVRSIWRGGDVEAALRTDDAALQWLAVAILSLSLAFLPSSSASSGVDLTPSEDKEYQLQMSGALFAERFHNRRDNVVTALYALLSEADATQALPFPFHFSSPGVAGELRGVAMLDTPEGHFANRSTHMRYRQSFAQPEAELTWKFETQDRDLAKAEAMEVDKR